MYDVTQHYTSDELIRLTQNLVKIPSHKNVLGQEREVVKFIYEFCKNNDIEVELQDVVGERKNVIAYIRGNGKGKSIMLNGHTDTVLPYNMTINPFDAFIKDGQIWGRGTVDMKGSLACMLVTMLTIKRMNLTPGGDIVFTAVIGEEGKSEGTEYIVKAGIKTDAAIVGEPSSYEYGVGHRGLEWFDVLITGKASHSGKPEKGVNAIDHAMTFIQKVKSDLYPKLKERHNEYMGDSIMNFGTIQGGTEQSTVADRCLIRIDRRYIPGETVETVMKEYQDILDELNKDDTSFHGIIKVTDESLLELRHPPLITSMNEPIVSSVREAMKEVINEEPKMVGGMGWTDAALLKTYLEIPTVVVGPGDLEFAHTEDERVAIKDLINFVEIYFKIIEKFCGLY